MVSGQPPCSPKAWSVHIEPVDIGRSSVDLTLMKSPFKSLAVSASSKLSWAMTWHQAGCVADGEQDRFVLGAGAVERFLAPGQPMDRVEAMLEKIGARFAVELVAAGSVVHHRFDSHPL
jgi:hypothetical protein